MSSLKMQDRRCLENFLGMGGGYVSGFSDRTFREFVQETVGIDIDDHKYTDDGTSKANRLRAFWKLERDYVVGELLVALIDYQVSLNKNAGWEYNQAVEECHEIAARLLAHSPGLSPLHEKAKVLNAQHLAEQVRRLATRLQTEPALWSAAIRDPGWRPTLAACTCLLVARERRFLRDLCDAFRGGSWVLPQVAVTLGILHPDEARSFFEAFLASEGGRSPKHVVSARRILECLGALSEAAVSPSGWSGSDADDAAVADAVVREHWEFWSSHSTRTA